MSDQYDRALESLSNLAEGASGDYSSRLRQRDMVRLRRQSVAIDQLLNGDFSYVWSELRRAFPTSHDTMPRRAYPLLQRAATELATLYGRSPRRLFLRGSDGAAMAPSEYQKLRDVYERSGVDQSLLTAHKSLIAQQTQVILVLPAGPRQVRVTPLSPYQCWVTPGDPMTADVIGLAKEVRLKLPVAASDAGVVLGWLVLTPNQIYWDVDGIKSSPYNRDKSDLSNPWPGTIPLVAVHSATPPPGCFLSSIDESLLAEQVGLCLGVSQLEALARFSGPRMYVEPGEGGGLTQELVDGLPAGHDTLIALPGAGSKLSVVQPQPMLGEYRALLDWQTGLSAQMRDVSPDAFSKSPAAKTSVSRAYDRADRAEHRRRYEGIFAPVETQLARVIAQVSNLTNPDGVMLPEDVTVRVEYVEPDDAPADPVHAAQAQLMSFRMGLDSPAAYMARQEGISIEAARLKIKANLAEWRAMTGETVSRLDIPPPGGGPGEGEQ